MTAAVSVSPLPYPAMGTVMLQVDWSGGLVGPGVIGEATVLRRVVGSTSTAPVIIPASMLGPNGGILLSETSGTLADTTAPLDVPIEYLSAPIGETSYSVSGQVTLASNGYWRLGDPLIPSSDVQVSVTRTTAVSRCSNESGIFLLEFNNETRKNQSQLTVVDEQKYPIHTSRVRLSEDGGFVLATRQLTDLDKVNLLLDTGNILCLRAPGATTYGMSVWFIHAGDVAIDRLTADMRRTWRKITIPTSNQLQPAGAASAPTGTSWDELCGGPYATLADLTAAGMTYTDASGGVVNTFPAAYRTCAEVSATWASCAALTATGKTCVQLVMGA